MLSDVDIRNELTKGIIIEPFKESSLTAVGYDMKVGEFGFSWNTKKELRIDQQGEFIIGPHDTVLISTYEHIGLSKSFGATVHSRVTLITHGIAHVSTTIDPGWNGRLLVQLHNERPVAIPIKFGQRFCTVCFHKLESESNKDHGHPTDREDIQPWLAQIRHEAMTREARLFRRNPRFQLCVAAIMIAIAGFLVWRLKPDWLAQTISILGVVCLFVVEALKSSEYGKV